MSDFIDLERYEAKYHIQDDMIPIIKTALQNRCQLDSACLQGAYRISSLYLDSPRLSLYHHTKLQMARRFKLRVRAYQNKVTFFEIKRRIKSIVYKSRVEVPYKLWPQLLQDPVILDQYTQTLSQKHASILQEFVYRFLHIHGVPQAIVEYTREAYEGIDDSYVRITIDRQMRACYMPDYRIYFSNYDQNSAPQKSAQNLTQVLHQKRNQPWYPIDLAHRFKQESAGAILEIKTKHSFPYWISDMIRHLNLSWNGFSKYGNAIETVHPHMSSIYAPKLHGLKH